MTKLDLKATAWLFALALALAPNAFGATPDPVFRAEEEADFAGVGNFLCQKALGLRFELPPPGFKVNKEQQTKLVKTLREPGPSAYGWVWLNEEKGQLIVIEMVKGPRTAEDFLYFAEKVEEGFGKATGFELVSREEKTDRLPFRFELSAKIGEDNAFDINCVSTKAGNDQPAVACMVTFAPDHDALAKNRDSFSFGGCK